MSTHPAAPLSGPVPLRRLLLSNLADASATQSIDLTLIMVAVTSLGLTAGQNGLLNALGSAAFLLLALPAGLAIDRHGPSVCLRISLTIKLTVTLAATGLLLAGALSLTATMAMIAALGIATVIAENAQLAITPLVARSADQIGSTVAALATADRAVSLLAPAAVGLALAAHLAGWVLGVGTLLAGLALALVPRVEAHAPEHPSRAGWVGALREGVQAFGSDRRLVAVTVLAAAGNAGLAIGSAVEPVLILSRLGLGTAFFGLLGTAGAIAGLVAATAAARVIIRLGAVRVFRLGALVQITMATLPALALLAPTAARWLLVGHAVGWAASMTLTNVATATWTAATVPRALLGRVSALRQLITMGVVPLASLAAAALAQWGGLWLPLAVWPLCILAGLIAFTVLDWHGAATREP